MPELTTQPAELRMTLQIVRAATGKTEIVELVGYVIPAPEAHTATKDEEHHGSHPLNSGP